MKIDGKKIPAPQNIKRREAFLLAHSDRLPKQYLQDELVKIAIVRSQKNLRWDVSTKNITTLEQRRANGLK